MEPKNAVATPKSKKAQKSARGQNHRRDMGQRSMAAGTTPTSALFGIMIPSSRTTSDAPH
jgi:hypothetical protein